MAAYAALASLMNIIDAIEHHPSPPISIHTQQAQSLSQLITSLQQFLESYTPPATEIDVADPLEMRIAAAAYAAEDIIESRIVNQIQRRTGISGFSNRFRASKEPKYFSLSEIERVFEEMESIKQLTVGIDDAQNQQLRSVDESASTSRSISARQNSITVCSDDVVNEVMEKLARGRSDRQAVPIVGMGGIVSEDDDQANFYQQLQRVIQEMESIKQLTVGIDDAQNQQLTSADASASTSRSISARQNSITVCSDDVVNEVMEKLARGRPVRQTVPIVGMGGIGKTTLARNVYTQQLIIQHFDIRVWATISQQYNTREILCQLLSQATNQDREELSKKSEDQLETKLYQHLCGRRYLIVLDDMWSFDAWDGIQRLLPNNDNGSRVLVTTRLAQLSSQLNENNSIRMKFLDHGSSWELLSKTVFGEESCPVELEKIGKKIVENCRGLPLSIVVVGGILKKTDRTQSSWESIRKNLSSLVNLENDKHCLRLLGLSYNHLPAYLKPCFLYMGVFEEDFKIKVSKLIKLWVCEGFLKPASDDSLETTAKELLKDLADRNLILIHKFGSTGNIKFCKIHDLLRDFCMNQSRKEGFYHVIGQSSPQGINGHRRVAIPRNTSKKKVRDDLRSMSHVRSVISENGNAIPSCRNFKLLRVVYSSRDYHYDGASRVNHRYLDVKVGSSSSSLLCSSISLQWNLQTLIVTGRFPGRFTVPIEIWKMTYLSHISLSGGVILPDPPSHGVVMKNLQVLGELTNFKISEKVVERIPNIKKLTLKYYGDDESVGYDCLSNVQQLCKLESLQVTLLLFRAKTVGSNFLSKLTFPHSLKKLYLLPYGLEVNDLLEKIGSLPHLEKFKLQIGRFPTGEWEVVEGQFPRLKYLVVDKCSDLKRLTTQEGSVIFPCLEQLDFSYSGLEEIPCEIGNVATLKRIELNRCGALLVKCAKEIVEEQVQLQGELPFHVKVTLQDRNEELLSLAGPYFKVS